MDLYPIEGPWSGQLALCSRPRSGPWLESDVRDLRSAGIGMLVSLLTAEEVAKLGLEPVVAACAVEEVEHVSFPVGNLLTPPFDQALPYLQAWNRALESGRSLALHCWATVGRSPTLAAGLLVVGGVAPASAWERVQASRGCPVPDTREQREWVYGLERLLRVPPGP